MNTYPTRRLLTMTLCTALGATASAVAQNWKMDLDVPASEFQTLFDTRVEQGFMLNAVTARADPAEARFQVTWIPTSGAWSSRHGDDTASLNSAIAGFQATGYRPVFVESYGDAPGNEQFVSHWLHDPATAWQVRTGLTPSQYQAEVTAWLNAGYSIYWVSANGTGANVRFACVFLQTGVPSRAAHGLSESSLSTFIASYPGERVVSLCSYDTGDDTYAVVMHGGSQPASIVNGDRKIYRTRLDSAEQAQQGYRTLLVDARQGPSNVKFWSVYVLDDPTDTWRQDGAQLGGLTAFDGIMQGFMQANGIRQGALAITRNGRLKLTRGYTNSPAACPDTKATSVMRIASVSKPMTAVGILRLAETGRLGPLGLGAPLSNFMDLSGWVDSRVYNITIRDLLHHRGGFDRNGPVGDPMFRDSAVSAQNNGMLPVTTAHIIQWMALRTLDAAPGNTYYYSNFGYSLLGRVIESATGKTYEHFMLDEVFGRVGMSSMVLGDSLFGDQVEREVVYGDLPGSTANSVMGGTPSSVPTQYGAWNMRNLDAHGGWVGSAVDLVRFADAFNDPSNSPLLSPGSISTMWSAHPNETVTNYYSAGWVRATSNSQVTFFHDGALSPDSTLSYMVRRPDGVNWAVVFNDSPPTNNIYSQITAQLDATASWPSGDLYDQIAEVAYFGQGCPVQGQQMRLRPVGGDTAVLGAEFVYQLQNLPLDPLAGLPLTIIGLGNQVWNGIPLPFSLSTFGAPGCWLNVRADITSVRANLGGYTEVSLWIPPVSNFVGASLFFQGGFLGASGIATSHGMSVRVGS